MTSTTQFGLTRTRRARRRSALTAAALAVAALAATGTGGWATGQSASPVAGQAGQHTHGPVVQPAALAGAHVQGTRTVQAYNYANAIRESVEIPTEVDSDGNGRRDTVMVDIIRPREAAERGVKVPVVAVASPYFTSMGRGKVSVKKRYDRRGSLKTMPLYYDNYFVERGYAVAAIDMVGTGRSSGCSDMGGKADVGSVIAAGKYLSGLMNGTYKAGGSGTASASSWSSGSYALIGKSYDGTLANGAAAATAPGLKTIVPISGISSWYDYTRTNGYVRMRNYASNIGEAVSNNARACAGIFRRNDSASDDRTGNYNSFFRERDYVPDASKVRASVFLVHGHNDLNVTTMHAGRWLTALQQHHVPIKVWVGEHDHEEPFDFRRQEWVTQLHEWFDYWLQGLDNSVMRKPLLDVETQVGTWEKRALGSLSASTGIGLTKGGLGHTGSGTVTVPGSSFRSEAAMVAQGRSNAAIFVSDRLSQPFSFAGVPEVKLRLKATRNDFPITVKLVDYGSGRTFTSMERARGTDCLGGKTATDDNCFQRYENGSTSTNARIIGRGWLSAQHRDSLSTPTAVPTGQWVDVQFPLMLNAATVPAGHQLGLVIGGAEGHIGRVRAASFELDLSKSFLGMPTSDAGLIRPVR